MDFLPIFLNVKGKRCLVVGGGAVAQRKAAVLIEAGAQVRVVAPELAEGFANLPHVEYVAARFAASHLDDMTLVIAATDDPAVNRQVSELAQARNIPVNVVDAPELCSFIMPAILDRSPLMVAVSSGGASPVLARMLRGKLESMIPQGYSRLAAVRRTLPRTGQNAHHRSGAAPDRLGERAGRHCCRAGVGGRRGGRGKTVAADAG